MTKILGMMLTVADIENMTTYFTKVLNFEKIGTVHLKGKAYEHLYDIPDAKAEFTILKLGNEYLYLIAFEPPGKSYPQVCSNDHLFQHIAIVVSDLEKAHQTLSRQGVTAISEKPVTIPEWNQAAAGIKAFYFRSPEGHPLELIYFPPQKGRLIWQEKGKLFLGIDHTAITISHTKKSLHFYQDLLGMTILGESLNHGDTQESLSRVPEARVKITKLIYQGVEEMGLEFLHYLHPTSGLPSPPLKANDLGCTYTVIEVDRLDPLQSVALSRGSFLPYDETRVQPAMIAQDPDGHRLLFVEKGDSPCLSKSHD